MTLDELGLQYGTDKASSHHGYMPFYEQHLAHRRHQPLTLLELGVKRGASLRVWRDWFPNAKIVGLDRKPPIEVDGCTIIQGSQDDPTAITTLAEHGPFDIIIDDASHDSSKTITSFELLYPHLNPAGMYIIEDLHSSYWSQVYGPAEANLNPGTTQATAMNFCKRLADEVNFDPRSGPRPPRKPALFPRTYWLGYHLRSVSFGYDICFIEKHE